MRNLNRRMGALSVAAALALPPFFASAQTAPTTDEATPAATLPAPLPPALPVTPVTTPPPQSATQFIASQPTTAGANQITLDFRDAPVDTVLEHLSEIAGFVVLKKVPITGRVTVLSKQPVSPQEAVALLDAVLRPNGFTAIQEGRILKIVAIDEAKHSNIPVHIGDDPDQIEESDEMITQVIPVKNVDAVKLKTDLQPLIGTDADVTANAASNALIITDTSANIHRVVEIVASLDKHEAMTSDIKVHHLKYADATAAAKLVMDIFAPTQTTQNNVPPGLQAIMRFRGFGGGGGGGGGGGAGGGGAGGGGGASDTDKGNTGHVQASADTRTNTVVVTGPPDTLVVIEDVLTQLDSDPAEQQTFFIYHVRNGQAVDMASTLNGLFSGNTSVNSSSQTNRSQTNSSTGNRVSNSNGSSIGTSSFGSGGSGGSSSFGQNSSNTNRGGNTSSGGGNNNNNANRGGGGASSGSANSSAINDLIGQVYVVPDADTNSLLVAANTKYEERVRAVILELDRPVPQVLIKVLIAEVTHDNSLDFGTDFSVLNLRASGNGQKLESSVGAAAAAASATAPPGLVLSMMESNVTATLQALAQQNKLDVLSRPYILTSDNQEADITVGDEVPFITESRTDENDNLINTIQYQDIGIILDVTPHINPDGVVIMQVNPQISSLTGQTVPIQAGVNAPVFELRSASAYVAVKDGQTIVIGGLMQDEKTESVSKIPLLGDLPYLGPLFSYRTNDKTKTELLIFITPHVAMRAEELKPMTEDEKRGLKLTPDAVQPGTFQEQMRGMSLGSTQPSTDEVPPQPVAKPRLGEPSLPGTGGK